MPELRPALFFDRDGVLNRDDNFVHRPDQFHWLDGAIASLLRLHQAGVLLVVVTNQSGIARNLYSEWDVVRLHDWMQQQLAPHGVQIDGFYYSPFHAEAAANPLYARDSFCRKPRPGMLIKAMRDLPIDPRRAALIGDRDTDIAAANAAGIPGYLFAGGNLSVLVDTIFHRHLDCVPHG